MQAEPAVFFAVCRRSARLPESIFLPMGEESGTGVFRVTGGSLRQSCGSRSNKLN
jgi:hypothetical protein